MNNNIFLEKKIADALNKSSDITSAVLAALLDETEAALAAAETDADEARQRALDPTVLDPAARTTMQDCEFLTQWLNNALSKLQQRYQQVADVAAHSAARRAISAAPRPSVISAFPPKATVEPTS
jgi:hypothetical protein